MYYLLDKKYDETFTINFIGQEEFAPGDTLKLTMPECVNGITGFDGYTDIRSGETESVYLDVYFRYKYSTDVDWSEPLPLDDLFTLEVCSRKCIILQLIYHRLDNGGDDSSITISLSNISINGTYTLTKSDSSLILTPDDPNQILEVGDYLKIFSIDDFEVISTSSYGNAFTIKYRFSQNNRLTWTEWEPLTKENISTVQWDMTRFVELQYLFEMNPDYKTPVKIYELLLYGDFQNVSANSLKLNIFGLKEGCINLAFPPAQPSEETSGINESTNTSNAKDPSSTTLSLLKEASEYQLRMNWLTNGLSCYSNPSTTSGGSVIDELSAENENNSSNFWNPYEFGKITEWHNMLAKQISDMLGMTIEYHLTDPDGNGIDKVIHEQQLFNIIDYKTIKALIPENQFQENQVSVNQFNLDLFDTFKIHILKDEFKNAFGINHRPSKEDILYFCQTNRMYIIKHTQIHKDVMNAGIYYDVVLEKYEQRSNVINRVEESKNRIEELTRNTTIDRLFGIEEEEEFRQIANKEQMKPKTFDLIRSVINPRTIINKENVYNGDIKVIESYYNLENVAHDENAIEYTKADNKLLKSDNRSFIFWFNFPNDYSEHKPISKTMIDGYDIDDNKYMLINNMSNDSGGYMSWFQTDSVYFMVNDTVYKMDVDVSTNVWYAVLINLDQRQRKIEMKLLRRNTQIDVILYQPDTYERLQLNMVDDAARIEYEMSVNGFRAVDNVETTSPEVNPSFIEEKVFTQTDIDPLEFEHDLDLRINGSVMKLSNIRVLNDLIREDYEEIILNQLIVKDAQHLILGDNANKKIQTTNYPNKQWR
jgi:hypothetical protein